MSQETNYPNVSILIPTWNRRNFLPLLMTNLYIQTYPKDKLEVVIFDDHKDNPLFYNDDEVRVISQRVGIKIRYIYDPKRHLSIGEKRNKLVKLADYKYLINIDDDDVYQANYIKYSMDLLLKNKCGLVGSPQMIFCYPYHNYKITAIKCPSKRQIHEATMCYTKKHWKSMGGYSKSGTGEGAGLVDFNENRCVVSECYECMICICHKNNTCEKEQFLEKDIKGDGADISDELKNLIGQCFGLPKV